MMYATISADIVDSTKFSTSDTLEVKQFMMDFLPFMEKLSKGSWGRVVKGDAFECVLQQSSDLLRVALMLKCYIKTFTPEIPNAEFSKYGVRMALAIGQLRTNDPDLGIIDGEAIYMSGRAIEEKQPNIRGTMMIYCNGMYAPALEAIVGLCDAIINKSTAKQCEVLFYKLSGMDEVELAKMMEVSRPTINKHSLRAGWSAIERAVVFFESIDF